MNSQQSILVTGSLAYDYIMDFPGSYEENILTQNLKVLSLSFLVDNFSKSFGGVAGNIVYSLSILRQDATLLASAGEKDFSEYKEHLQKQGTAINSVNIVSNMFTANAFIMTDRNNCQIAGFYPGAMQEDISLTIPQNSAFSLAVITPTVPGAMESLVLQAQKQNIPYLFDPAQQLPRLTKEQLITGINGAEIVIGNDYEIDMLMKKTELSMKDILNKTKIIITTLGSKGSIVQTAEESITVGVATPDEITDPTGAGDAYIAGFIAGYTQALPLKKLRTNCCDSSFLRD